MASIFRASAAVRTPSDDLETYGSGPNTSRALAVAELNSILATVVGLGVERYSISEQTDPTTEGAALNSADAQFEDSVLVLTKSVGGKLVEKTLTVENMSLGYKVAVAGSNLVEVTDADLAAIASAYHDGSGVGGYDFAPGKSYFKN
jgi:hypothetical protein